MGEKEIIKGCITFNKGNEWTMFEGEYFYSKGLQKGINEIFKFDKKCNSEVKECLAYFNDKKEFVENLIKIKLEKFMDETSMNNLILRGIKICTEKNNSISDLDLNSFACSYIKTIVRKEMLNAYKQVKSVTSTLFNNYLEKMCND